MKTSAPPPSLVISRHTLWLLLALAGVTGLMLGQSLFWMERSALATTEFAQNVIRPHEAEMNSRLRHDVRHEERMEASPATIVGAIKTSQLRDAIAEPTLVEPHAESATTYAPIVAELAPKVLAVVNPEKPDVNAVSTAAKTVVDYHTEGNHAITTDSTASDVPSKALTTSDLIATYLIDKRDDPASISNTSLDQALARKYNETCVKLGGMHMELSFPAPTRCFSRAEVQTILRNIALTTSAVFTQHNITYFLDSGTLLGAVRHKNVIPFDQDVDLGIDERGYEILKTTPVQFPNEYALHVFNSSLHSKGSRGLQVPVRVTHIDSTLFADVFVYLDSTNDAGEPITGPMSSGAFFSCVKCPQFDSTGARTFKIPYDWIYPLQPCRLAGYELPCPNKPTEYLLYMFGDGYMTPKVFDY